MQNLIKLTAVTMNGVNTNAPIIINENRIVSSEAYGSNALIKYRHFDDKIYNLVVSTTYSALKTITATPQATAFVETPALTINGTQINTTLNLLVSQIVWIESVGSNSLITYMESGD